MSEQQININCPRCNFAFQVTIETVVTPDSPASEALKEAKLNIMQCPDCKIQALLPSPFLFFNPEKDRIICYIPEANKKTDAEINNLVQALIGELSSALGEEIIQQGKVKNVAITENYANMVDLAKGELHETNTYVDQLLLLLQSSPIDRKLLIERNRGSLTELMQIAKQLESQAHEAGNLTAAKSLKELALELAQG